MVKKLLEDIKKKHKVKYDYFRAAEEMELPYIIYFNKEKSFSGDNKNYAKTLEWYIELYSDDPETEIEEDIEKALDEIYFTKEKDYIQSEDMYLTLYKFNLIKKGK